MTDIKEKLKSLLMPVPVMTFLVIVGCSVIVLLFLRAGAPEREYCWEYTGSIHGDQIRTGGGSFAPKMCVFDFKDGQVQCWDLKRVECMEAK